MIRFKIFFGTLNDPDDPADEKLNAWLSDHPKVEILKFKYQQARYGDHSICIEYEE